VPNPFRSLLQLVQKRPKDEAKDLTMRQVLSVSKPRALPSMRQWKQLPTVLTNAESRVIKISLVLILLSVIFLLGSYILTHRIEIPAVGGEYTEGLVGEPQFINPLYASASDVDRDLTHLVFSGLLKWDAEDGFVPDLAEDLFVNAEKTIYTLRIRENAVFHDSEQVRARDVVFTFNALQNASYRSPLGHNYASVSVVQEDDRTVAFILEEPSATFTEHLTVGILPASHWANILPQNAPLAALNLQPIGAGPYKFAEFAKDKKGAIRSYTLERNEDYYGATPLIEDLNFKFYPDTLSAAEALENKNVEGISIVDIAELEVVRENKNVRLVSPLMPREVVMLFNEETNQVLSDFAVRSAINQAIDKDSLVQPVHGDAAKVIHGPLLSTLFGYTELTHTFDLDAANAALDAAGYSRTSENGQRLIKGALIEEMAQTQEGAEEEMDVYSDQSLRFTLTTAASLELILVAEEIQADLLEIGILVDIVTTPPELLFAEVIEPRNFEMLLTPLLLGAKQDLYPFWHSSQVDDGLNLAGYANEDVDTLLDEVRIELDDELRKEKLIQIQELLAKDVPAVFLYQAPYYYAVAEKIQNVVIPSIIDPTDRFANIETWYIKTKKALR
jgi:peptide/nickel transport system substrate-binding protein